MRVRLLRLSRADSARGTPSSTADHPGPSCHVGNIINLVANAISASWEESSCPELDRQAAVQVRQKAPCNTPGCCVSVELRWQWGQSRGFLRRADALLTPRLTHISCCAYQVCVQLAGSMVAWLSRGAAGCMGAVAAAPATCGHLQVRCC